MAGAAQPTLLANHDPVPQSVEVEVLDTDQQQGGSKVVRRQPRVDRPRTDPQTGALSEQVVAALRGRPNPRDRVSHRTLGFRELSGGTRDPSEEQSV